MKSIGEALRAIVPCFEPIGTVRRPLLDALGGVLAEDVWAQCDLPGFDNSAMDGYAVRHADLAPGTALPLQGESRAGGPPPAPLAAGHALRIFTGAPMPAFADTVVIQENARASGASVAFDPIPTARANVRARASDLAAGTLALATGVQLGPGEIGLLAAQQQHSVCVYQRPRVAILSTGDELREIGQRDEAGGVVNSNAYALAAQVLTAGADPWVLPIARDQLDDLDDKLEQALRADVVLSAGGVSVGEYDLVAKALQNRKVELKLWKVAIRPGKPLLFGMRGAVPVVGLPGNPVSAMVTFEVFVRPALQHMLGHPTPYPSLIDVRLAREHRHATGRTELARARLARAADGILEAHIAAQQGSGSLPSMCGVDALVVLAAERAAFGQGAIVPALPLAAPPRQGECPFA